MNEEIWCQEKVKTGSYYAMAFCIWTGYLSSFPSKKFEVSPAKRYAFTPTNTIKVTTQTNNNNNSYDINNNYKKYVLQWKYSIQKLQ